MTPSREDLLERLKAATDQLDDDTLGRMIAFAKGLPFDHAEIACGDDGSAAFQLYCYPDHVPQYIEYRCRCPDVSLDAALALVERVLPGWVIEMCLDAKGGSAAIAPLWWNPRYDEDATDMKGAHETAPTLPLAVLTALLSALPADSLGQEETGK